MTGRHWAKATRRQVAPGAGALTGPLAHECPRCGAAPGHSCTRYTPALIDGEDVGGGYTRTLAKPHRERRAKRRPASEGT